MTKNEALSKAMKLCSVKEYAPFEIEQKILTWGLSDHHVEEIIKELIEDKFIDEFRMARFFVSDKLKFNKWGKIKIKFMLQQKKLSREVIQQALDVIDHDEYHSILQAELKKKLKSIKDTDEYRIKAKLFQFASGKGFEPDLIYSVLSKDFSL